MITAIIENSNYPLNKMVILRYEDETQKYVIASVKMHKSHAQTIADAVNKHQNPLMVVKLEDNMAAVPKEYVCNLEFEVGNLKHENKRLLDLNLKTQKVITIGENAVLALVKQIKELKNIINATDNDLYKLQNSKSTEMPDGQTCHTLLHDRMEKSGLFEV